MHLPNYLSFPIHHTRPDRTVYCDVGEAEPDHKRVCRCCLPPVEVVSRDTELLGLTDSFVYNHLQWFL